MGESPIGNSLIDFLLDQLAEFTGNDWEQEDDVTLVTLRRCSAGDIEKVADEWRILTDFNVASEPGNERIAMNKVAEEVKDLGLPEATLEKLKTAVAEATMNAMEHGNNYRADIPVVVNLMASRTTISVRITDRGSGSPMTESEAPDVEAKLSGEQSPRGWGLFLIKNMVDEMRVTSDETHHTVELILNILGDQA